MNPRFGRRSWVKLWVNEWLDGTTRFEMTDAQRAFWVDLLAMAGRSRFGGKICAGEVNGAFVGYPVTKFQSLMAEPIDVLETLELFRRTGKITIQLTSKAPIPLYMIELVNWDRYQSEYQRQKKYRKSNGKLQRSDSRSDTQSNLTEGEVEGEVEGEEKRRSAATAFIAIGFDTPFGQKKFQKIWQEEFEKPCEWLTLQMEAAIQECQRRKIGIPPQFFQAKRDIEAKETAEANRKYRKTPL